MSELRTASFAGCPAFVRRQRVVEISLRTQERTAALCPDRNLPKEKSAGPRILGNRRSSCYPQQSGVLREERKRDEEGGYGPLSGPCGDRRPGQRRAQPRRRLHSCALPRRGFFDCHE